MTEEPLSIEEVITELGNCDNSLLNTTLTYLSNLSPAEMALFKQAWAVIGLERRRQIMSRLVEMAENNFELNFDSVFKHGFKDEDTEVRARAIEGLWESEEASLIDPLIYFLEQDRSEKVQATAATALGKFAMLAELEKLRSCHASKIGNALLEVLNDRDKPLAVRRRALESVAPLSTPEVKEAIVQAYRSYNPKLRASAVYAMGKNCSRSWLSVLLKELDSADDEIRYEAAGACGELGERDAVPYLVKLINDPDTSVQLVTIQALGKIGGRDAREWLKQCLNHPSKAIQEAAEQAIVELEAEENPLSFWGEDDL